MQVDPTARLSTCEGGVGVLGIVRLLPGTTDRPGFGGHQARVVGEGIDVRAQARIDPGLGQHVGGMSGQSGAEREPGIGRACAQLVEVGPGSLGIDVVGRQRAHATPVVDTGGEERREVVAVREIGRCLHAHGRAEDHASGRDRREIVVAIEVGYVAHRGVVFGPEVLDDHLLHVPMAAVCRTDREERIDALGGGLADADEDAGGERDREATGILQDPEPNGGFLVGAAEMRRSGLGPQALGCGLEHHAHARCHRPQTTHLVP